MKYFTLFLLIVVGFCQIPNDPYFSGTNRLVQHDLQPQYWRNEYQWHLKNDSHNTRVYNFDWSIIYSQFDEPVGINDMEAIKAWGIESSATNVLIGVIDSGVNTNHVDLIGRINLGKSWTAFGDGNFLDENASGHGTKMIGTLAAIGNNGIGICGILKDGGNIAILKKINNTTPQFIEAIRVGVSNGCRIIYFSTGFPSKNDTNLQNIIRESTNTLFVCPALNSTNADYNRTNNPYQVLDYPISWNEPNVVAVTISTREGLLYSVGGYGSNYIDLAAQGRLTITLNQTNNTNYLYTSGTSPAGIHVVGGLALILEHWPDAHPLKAKQKLLESVTKIAGFEHKVKSGGILNLYQSLLDEGLRGLNATQLLVMGPTWKTYGLFHSDAVLGTKTFIDSVNGGTVWPVTNLGYYFVTNAVDLGLTRQQKQRANIFNTNTYNGPLTTNGPPNP